jgi:hypothetical protein
MEVSSAAVVVASKMIQVLTRNDPSQMPGYIQVPPIRSPASARPEAGQIAVA